MWVLFTRVSVPQSAVLSAPMHRRPSLRGAPQISRRDETTPLAKCSHVRLDRSIDAVLDKENNPKNNEK